jgi:hypothetical protein
LIFTAILFLLCYPNPAAFIHPAPVMHVKHCSIMAF